jgi:anti-anti-sigma factor
LKKKITNNEIVPDFDTGRDDSLKIDLRRIDVLDAGLVLVLTGYIDTYNCTVFEKRVERAIGAGFSRLIFDCSGLNYISSTGIGSFTGILKTLKSSGGDIMLLGLQPKVYMVFELLGFANFFKFKGNIEDAVRFFKNGTKASHNSIFPQIFECPLCRKKLVAVKKGRFRCARCKTILAVDGEARVFLG